MRDLPGQLPTPDFGYLAAAQPRRQRSGAGIQFELDVPLMDGSVRLPGLAAAG